MTSMIVPVLIMSACVLVYLFPAIVAAGRHHNNADAILVLNLFFGWSFVGWVVALVWSLTSNRRIVNG